MKNLKELIDNHAYLRLLLDATMVPSSLAIAGITENSARCQMNFLFVAVKNATTTSRDGHDFIDDAIRRGATAVVVDAQFTTNKSYSVPVLTCPDSKLVINHLVEAFFDFPSKKIAVIGITGTNGKTSTSFMLHSILSHHGFKPKIMGTLGLGDPSRLVPATHTTMEPEFISAHLNQWAEEGVTHVIMEVSSHALALKRVEAIKFHAVGLTNITQDHLDLHGTMENYQNAKARLFFDRADDDTILCLPTDHPFDESRLNKNKLTLYGALGITSSHIQYDFDSLSFDLGTPQQKKKIHLPFMGDFHVNNATLAASMALSMGLDIDKIASGLKNTSVIPGRLEQVKHHHNFGVFIDFAHTPDGLASMLKSMRRLERRIILVFGCGGDRDREKRPLMGAIAENNADIVILTDDNPRHEDPDAIRLAIKKGMKNNQVIERSNRHEAIAYAIAMAQKNDIVIIAGKGHESFQIYGDDKQAFNDVHVTKEILEKL